MELKRLITATEKFGIFVDVQNIYYTTRDTFGRSFDYRRLWNMLSRRGDIVLGKAYATDRGDESQKKFQRALVFVEVLWKALTLARPKVGRGCKADGLGLI